MSTPPVASTAALGSQLLATVFLRLVFPLVLAACIVFRPSGFSFLYLLLFLYLPLVPRPTVDSFTKGATGRYLRLCLLITFATVISQIVFQILLVSLPPYGDFLVTCELLETILRHIGLVKLSGLYWTDILKWTGPDAAALAVCVITYIFISNLVTTDDINKSKKNNVKKIMSSIGPYITVAFLCFTSSLQPSVASGIYYLVFLGCATYWSLNKSLRNKIIKWLFCLLAIFVMVHIICLFIYQLNFIQSILDPTSQPARLAGLVPIILTDCDGDPRRSTFNSKLKWPSFTSPFALLFLFQLLVYNFRIFSYSQPQDKYALSSTRQSIPRQSSFSRRRQLTRHRPTTMRWKSSTRRLMTFSQSGSERGERSVDGLSRVNSATADHPQQNQDSQQQQQNRNVLSEQTTFESDEGPAGAGTGGEPRGSETQHSVHHHGPDGSARASTSENLTYTYILLSGLFTIYDLFAKSSYVATNVLMMAWSITYHSWLTFILLLWACVLWMFPNQRKAMLLSSPFLVFYAEILLLAEYVFSLDLTEDELPKKIEGFNLAEFGLVKHGELACYPILIKCLYTLMFWITLRQFVMERISPLEEQEVPVTVTVRRRTLTSELMEAAELQRKSRKGIIDKIGNFLKETLTKFWIWIVAIFLFVIGLGGDQVVLYRIVYMALFLIFVLTFQLSYGGWRKMMYTFWLTVIVYSMLVLVMIYTYQFEDIPELISNYTGIPEQLQKDIGLERYDTGSLFVRLLTPTFFLIITVIQLHYFHKDFLSLSDLNKPRELEKSPSTESDCPKEKPPPLVEDMTLKNIWLNAYYYGQYWFTYLTKIYLIASEICWRFLEIHILKIVLFSAVMLTVYDKCALHFVLFLGVVNAVVVKSSLQRILTHLCSIFISLLLLAKMIYQIDYINHSSWNSNCTYSDRVIVKNDAEWLGLRKIQEGSSLPDLLKGYIGMILVLTVQAVVQIRQAYQRNIMRHGITQQFGILFPNISRADADKGLLPCFKFLMNYGFYKFGVEITLIAMVIVIGTRLDVFSVLYSFWLIAMFYSKRNRLANLWLPLILFISILLPFQYMACVGLPPFLCPDYVWSNIFGKELKSWLFLPDYESTPIATRIIPDFFLLLFASQQKYVFWIEKNMSVEYAGGTNEEVTDLYATNNVPDFLTYTKTWLDIIKKCLFLTFYWTTLGIIFLTGTNRVNLFALGYLVGSFIFLWEGNEFYLRAKKSIIERWNYLLAFNVFVIFSKSFLQLIGCVFLSNLQYNFCWFVQLFGIACLNKFQAETSAMYNAKLTSDSTCHVPHDEAGLFWDGITFGFLLFQRRIFNSFYFHHIRAETEAQAALASRGAELIEELMQKQIKQQEEQEKDVLEKIKMKMERIIATHQRGKKQDSKDHFDAIRSGDYYMFDQDDDEMDMIDMDSIPEDKEDEDEKVPGMTISELMSSALKTDVESAAQSARLARHQSTTEVGAGEGGGSADGVGGVSKQESIRSKRFRKISGKRRSFARRRLRDDEPSTSAGTGQQEQQQLMSDEERRIQQQQHVDYPELEPAPLALSDGSRSQISHYADDSGGGGGGPPEGPHDQGSGADLPISEDERTIEEPGPNLLRRIIGYIKFAWAFVESLMISCTGWLNKFSRDYRHVSRCLSEEKLTLKDKKSKEIFKKIRVQPESVKLDIGIPPGMEESPDRDRGGEGDDPTYSRDDLQTVVEKPSPSRDLSIDTESSLDDISLSEVEKEHCPLVLLVVALWYVIISHSDLVCYFVVFLNQIKSASILSLPLPLMVLLWGTLSVPRPTKTFWVTIIAYTEAMVVIKYLFQFDFFSWNEGSLGKKDPFWPPKILGIEQKEKYALYDVTLLMAVFLHRFMLKSLGLWKNKSDNVSSDSSFSEMLGGVGLVNLSRQQQQAATTSSSTAINKIVPVQNDVDDNKFEENENEDGPRTSSNLSSVDNPPRCLPLQVQWEKWEIQESLAGGPEVIKICILKYLSSINQFFQQILNLEYKVKVDVYSYMFICDFFNFLVVIFGFASFGSSTGDVSSYLEENKVPIPFLVMVILQFALIVIDRALYLRKYILGKFFFQMFLVSLVHVAMFFVLPAVTERDFNTALPPQMWYMVKCIYLLFSAYQIRSGYPTRILGNFLCKKYNYMNMFLFRGFMAVPFLFELRALMDWMWTETSMTLSDWLKLEDIFAHIFQLKCQRRVEKEYPQLRGSARRRWTKYAIGGSSLLFIIAIIWFPLVLFALGNTVGLPNPPIDVSVQLTIGAYQPLFTMSAQNTSLKKFNSGNWNNLNYIFRNDRQALSTLGNYEPDDVVLAKLSVNSSSTWSISPPSKLKLIEELNSKDPVPVKFSWTVTRDKPNPTIEASARDKHEIVLQPNDPNRKLLVDAISANSSSEVTHVIKFNGIFPKFLRISNSGKAQIANFSTGLSKTLHWRYTKFEGDAVLRNFTLRLRRLGEETWWQVDEDCIGPELKPELPFSDQCAHLNLFTFSEKAFPSTLSWLSGGGIIGLYTTLVLVASKFVRSFFAGISFLIMFDDMPNVDRVFQLCLDIYLVRESGELALEEDLFAKLIFLYRSPETLIKWTRPPKKELLEKRVKEEADQQLKQIKGPTGPAGDS